MLVPGSLLWIMLIFAVRTYRTSGAGSVTSVLVAVGIGVAVLLAVAFLVPDRELPQEATVELASDYPVPPLDLVVPTTPRSRDRAVETGPGLAGVSMRKETE